LLVLFTALLFRMIGVVFAVSGGNLNKKEKIFMAFAWLPKAAVQAAIGPVFLDNARKFNKPEWEPMGREILTLAVLSILITAPLGAISIVFLGPRLLEKQEQNLQDVEPKPTRKVESEAEVNQLPPPHLPPPPSYAETKELP
jgi:NhaP-type Na+/H+ or K+/H+ antiporter